MSELAKRVLFSFIAGPIFLYVTWLGKWYFHILILIIGMFIVFEMSEIAQKVDLPANRIMSFLFGAWIILSPQLPDAPLWGLLLLILFIAYETFNENPDSIKHIFGTFFSGLYAPIGLLCMIQIRNMDHQIQGFALVLSLLLGVWGNDVFAYFGGKAFGKHLMAPKISPKKTWEGFLSGFLGVAVGLAIVWGIFGSDYPLNLLTTILLGIIISIFGPVGDLAESKFKRFANIKDSSSFIPGHGGFFDRFDALLMSSMAMYLYLQFFK